MEGTRRRRTILFNLTTSFCSNTTEQREPNYFTIDHILADIPNLISKVKEDLNSTSSRVVVFGSRIGGAVAVLARKRFPHIIDGAWSTSGLFQSVTADTSYYNDISLQLHTHGGAKCTSVLSKAFQQVKEIVDAKNMTALQKLFLIEIIPEAPIDLNKPHHTQFFYYTLFNSIRLYIYGIK